MPSLSEPVACAIAIAASFAEISSNARNRSATRYGWPRTSPAMFGVTLVACADATTVASGFSSGTSVTAVSIFSVLAGRSRPCGSLAASTWPVPASATTYAEAGTAGSRAACPAG